MGKKKIWMKEYLFLIRSTERRVINHRTRAREVAFGCFLFFRND